MRSPGLLKPESGLDHDAHHANTKRNTKRPSSLDLSPDTPIALTKRRYGAFEKHLAPFTFEILKIFFAA